jgi:RAB protein geranylgeranyltransferase component A
LYGGGTLYLFVEQCMESQRKENIETAANVSDGVEKDFIISLLPKEKYASLRLHSQTILCQNNVEATSAAVVPDEDAVEPKMEQLAIQEDAVDGKGGDHTSDATINNLQALDPSNNTKIKDSSDQLDGFSLDISPCLLYASGDAVEGLVKSGVSDYLEFKSVEGLFVLMAEDDSSKSSSRRVNRDRNKRGGAAGNRDDNTSNDKPLVSYRVPCSKADVFRSKLLSPVDKRRLMKFLQLITDYGMAMASQTSAAGEQSMMTEATADTDAAPKDNEEFVADTTLPTSTNNNGEDAIQSVNERRLHRGRALSRPQNKATPSSSDMESLIRCVRDGVSFSDFLRTVVKLPDRLAVVVVYALALSSFGYINNEANEPISDAMARVSKYSTKDGVEDLLLHVTALGRFGHTAFLTAMYGSGELSQAFCRSGAVYGSTYMLRRPPLRITLEEGSPRVRGVVLGGEGILGFDDGLDQEILCEHVIVPTTMIDPSVLRNTVRTRTYRRISILRGKLVTAEPEQNDTDNSSKTEQRYAIIIPPGTRGLSNQSAIHGIAVDDSVCVSPRGKQYTVLHLTMTSPEDSDSHDVFDETLGQAVQHLIASQLSTNEETSPVVECHHVSFSFTSDSSDNITEDNQTSGLHIAYRDTQSITCDSAFREAKRIFDKICPDADFLGLAKKVEDEIVYRNEEDSDDEKVVLESAVTMIEAPLSTGKTSYEGEPSKEEQKTTVPTVD